MTNYSKSNVVDIECILVHETDDAWLINAEDEDDETKNVWVPKSVGELVSKEMSADKYILTVPQRFAEKKELV